MLLQQCGSSTHSNEAKLSNKLAKTNIAKIHGQSKSCLHFINRIILLFNGIGFQISDLNLNKYTLRLNKDNRKINIRENMIV